MNGCYSIGGLETDKVTDLYFVWKHLTESSFVNESIPEFYDRRLGVVWWGIRILDGALVAVGGHVKVRLFLWFECVFTFTVGKRTVTRRRLLFQG